MLATHTDADLDVRAARRAAQVIQTTPDNQARAMDYLARANAYAKLRELANRRGDKDAAWRFFKADVFCTRRANALFSNLLAPPPYPPLDDSERDQYAGL